MTAAEWHACPVCGAETEVDMTPRDVAAVRYCSVCEWSVEIPRREVST